MAQRVGIGNNYQRKERRRKGYFKLTYGWTSEAGKKSWCRRIGSDILMFKQKLWELQISTPFKYKKGNGGWYRVFKIK